LSVYSPVVTGSGVSVIHNQLSEALKNYDTRPVDPNIALRPWKIPQYKNETYNIVHGIPDFGASYVGSNQKAVFTFHNYYLDAEMKSFSSVAQRAFYKTMLSYYIKSALKRADSVTAVSDFTANLIRRDLDYPNIHVIKNGVDCIKFKPREVDRKNERIRVLFTGNITKRKGFNLLEQLSKDLPANIEIAFTSGLRPPAHQHSYKKMTNLGSVAHREMPSVYQSADILFFPTLREGFGLSALEAMACGIPVVSTNCSSIPEVVTDKKGGFLCSPNDITDMKSKIIQLALSPSLRSDMGAFNRERALREFPIEKMLLQYEQLFSSLSSA
jgi:L-malate glycosyltransferase